MFITGLVFALLCSGEAYAQKSADHLLAKKHYELGAQLYKTSDYPRALAEFEEAYRLAKKPGLLFNIARCHEVMANLEQAMKYYRMFLAQVPDTPKRSLVESRLRNLEKRLAARQAQPGPAPAVAKPPERPAPATPATAPVTATDQRPARGSWRRTAGWITLGTGGAALITGIVFGVMASGKATVYEDEARTKSYEELADLRSDGEGLQSLQIGLLVAGGVLAAAGGGLLLWHHEGNRGDSVDSAMVAPLISHDTVGLVGRLRF